MWCIRNSFWAAQSPLCRWRTLTLIDWCCGFCGESRIERVPGDVTSMTPQKSWGLKPRCQCVLELLSCRQMKNLTASLRLCTPGVDLLSECVSSPPTPPCAAVVQHCIILAVKPRQRPRDPSTAEGLEDEMMALSAKSPSVWPRLTHMFWAV